MSQSNKLKCKRDSKGKFVKTTKFQWRQNVLEGIQRRTIKLRTQQVTQSQPGIMRPPLGG